VIQAAQASGADVLYCEDLSDGQHDGLKSPALERELA
jgi:hypothetical protein